MPKKTNGSAGRKSKNGASRKPVARAVKRNTAIPKIAPRKASAKAPPSIPSRRPDRDPAAVQRPPQLLQPPARSQRLPNVSGEITHDMIANRAYEIYLSGAGGSEFDNWCRAERELRGA